MQNTHSMITCVRNSVVSLVVEEMEDHIQVPFVRSDLI